jgi:L-threonylcarbamoyladenylate synthase
MEREARRVWSAVSKSTLCSKVRGVCSLKPKASSRATKAALSATRNLTSISTECIFASIRTAFLRVSLRHNERVSKTTLHLIADANDPERSSDAIEQAAAILRHGGTVAFPTETVYGLGAHALDRAAVAAIFAAKQRPAWDPLIVHVADPGSIGGLVREVTAPAALWMEQFWPGPLTLLLEKSTNVPDAVTAGRSRVGVRVPRHPVAHALLRAAGIPIAAPSANLFGHVSPTTAAHVLADLDGRIDAVLDGGACEHGLESTVVDAAADPCVVYRPGAVSLEQLVAVWPGVVAYQESGLPVGKTPASLPSPGVGIRHYAPRARVVLIEYGDRQAERLGEALAEISGNARVGVLLPEGFSPGLILRADVERYTWGVWTRPESMARSLFAGLRSLDGAGVARIVCPVPPAEGIGRAISDRLHKAARPM